MFIPPVYNLEARAKEFRKEEKERTSVNPVSGVLYYTDARGAGEKEREKKKKEQPPRAYNEGARFTAPSALSRGTPVKKAAGALKNFSLA